MARIPPDLHDEILARSGQGISGKKIADWLLEKHQVKATQQAISKLVKKHRAERQAITTHVVREHLEKTLPADLDERSRIVKAAEGIFWTFKAQHDETGAIAPGEAAIKALAPVLRAWEQQDKALGLNEPDGLSSKLLELLGEVLD